MIASSVSSAALGFGEEQDIVIADLSTDARRQFTEAWIQTHGVAVPEPEAVPPSTWQSLVGFFTGQPPEMDERRVSDQSALRRAIQLGRLYSPRSFTVEDNFSVSSGLSGNPALAARCGLNTPVDQLLSDRLQNVDFDYSSATIDVQKIIFHDTDGDGVADEREGSEVDGQW